MSVLKIQNNQLVEYLLDIYGTVLQCQDTTMSNEDILCALLFA